MQNNPDKQINVRMSFELYKNSKRLADNSGWTLAAWIRKAMEEKVKRDLGSADTSADAEPVTRAEIKKLVQDTIREELRTGFPITPMKKEECNIQR